MDTDLNSPSPRTRWLRDSFHVTRSVLPYRLCGAASAPDVEAIKPIRAMYVDFFISKDSLCLVVRNPLSFNRVLSRATICKKSSSDGRCDAFARARLKRRAMLPPRWRDDVCSGDEIPG